MTQAIASSMHEEAVQHAHAAERAAELSWRHLHAEFSQDIEKVLATLATSEPLSWTLPDQFDRFPGPLHFLSAVTLDEIRHEYELLRQDVEIWGWEALNEIRQGWYVLTHGVTTIKTLSTGETSRGETVTMFPVGRDGILGEVQIGGVGTFRENRWPEVPSSADDVPLPQKRLEALALHNQYVEDLRNENVSGLGAAHPEESAATIRNYLTDESTVLNATGRGEIEAYFSELFRKYKVQDVRLVNRIVESWYVFAELHWIVEERGGDRRTLEFCTAETSPLDPQGRFWVRTGAGTDPIQYAG
jgi:hypothetical protein